jgi:hypothetical protein
LQLVTEDRHNRRELAIILDMLFEIRKSTQCHWTCTAGRELPFV